MQTSGPGWNAVHNCYEQYATFSRTRSFCPPHAARHRGIVDDSGRTDDLENVTRTTGHNHVIAA